MDKRNTAAAEKAVKALETVRDRRRLKITPVPTGYAKAKGEATMERTIYPERVRQTVPEDAPLMSGDNNAKLGGQVLVGKLTGAALYSLTLEERATCPRSCLHWTTCYGNNMQHAARWAPGPALETALARQVRELCTRHRQVLIRLHVLGDFYSVDYIAFWHVLLKRHKNLHVFGFTAHPPESDEGYQIRLMNEKEHGRSYIRFSGRAQPMGSFTVDFPTDRKQLGDAIVCPEQRAAMEGRHDRHCGNCAVCWSCNAPIVFIEH